jgi:nicotinate-nucleotide--dimethylbenzimidazole phosphoribosyltransferase
MTGQPITIEEIVLGIESVDTTWIEKARERTAQLVIPPRALGRLHDFSEQLCGIQKTLEPSIDRKAFLVMAGDHGVAAGGVSAFPQQVTGEMIRCFLMGGAGINILAGQAGADVFVVDMGIIPDLDPAALQGGDRLFVEKIAPGTHRFDQGPAMTRSQAEASILAGFRRATALFEAGADILGTGDMGIGNTTPSAAIGAVITGASLEDMVGRGTGIDDHALITKKKIVQQGIDINRPSADDGLDVLSKIGGFEIGGIAGIILAAAWHKKPVMIDGFISTAGALIAGTLSPDSVPYMFAGHCSEEPGHGIMLGHLGLAPILNLGMRLGEGTGGALAMNVLEGAIGIFRHMLTFEQAGVTDGSDAPAA